jgi:hypothetical protein
VRAHTHAPAGATGAVQQGTERRGLEELRQLAREGAPPVPLLEDAFRVIFDKSPRFKRREWGGMLESACRTYDRWGLPERSPGLGVSVVIDRMLEDRRDGVPAPGLVAAQNAPQQRGPCRYGICAGDGWVLDEHTNDARRCRCAGDRSPHHRRAEPVSLAYYAKWLKTRARYARQDGRGFRRAGLQRPAFGGAS